MIQRLLNRFGFYHRSQIGGRRNWGGFPAAQQSRLTEDLPRGNVSIDSLLRTELPILRARGRYAQIRDPYFNKAIGLFQRNIIGSEGMTLKGKAVDRGGNLDQDRNKRVEDAWFEWGEEENCCMSKDLTWFELQNLAVSTFFCEGEIINRFVRGPRAQNRFNFALSPMDNDTLDIEKNALTPEGGQIRLGVQKDSWGRRQQYWFRSSNPSDMFQPVGMSVQYSVLPASEIIHTFIPQRIGQTRGYPFAAASMSRLNMLAGYEESEEVRARAASSKMLFFKRQPGTEYTGPVDGDKKLMDFEPGLAEELDPGLEPMPIDWHSPSQNYDPFVKATLRGIAAGIRLSYPTLSNDYAELSFSAGRMSQLEEREEWKALQTFTSLRFHNPIYNAWLEMSLMSGAIEGATIADYEQLKRPTFHGRRWTWVDPQKEVSAATDEINSGLTSWSRKVTEMGYDADELLAEIQMDQKKLAKLPIPLPNVYVKQLQKANGAPDGDQSQKMLKVNAQKIVVARDMCRKPETFQEEPDLQS